MCPPALSTKLQKKTMDLVLATLVCRYILKNGATIYPKSSWTYLLHTPVTFPPSVYNIMYLSLSCKPSTWWDTLRFHPPYRKFYNTNPTSMLIFFGFTGSPWVTPMLRRTLPHTTNLPWELNYSVTSMYPIPTQLIFQLHSSTLSTVSSCFTSHYMPFSGLGRSGIEGYASLCGWM